jgi:hypothetical protein
MLAAPRKVNSHRLFVELKKGMAKHATFQKATECSTPALTSRVGILVKRMSFAESTSRDEVVTDDKLTSAIDRAARPPW